MTSRKIYTPSTLAEKWECSSQHIRNLCRSGELPFYRLGGKLIRIKAEDVEDFECRTGVSQDLEESSASPGPMKQESADVIDLELQTQKRRPAAPRLDTRNSHARPARQ